MQSPVFVQFPHPGDEHNPGKLNRQPWNRCEHRRKFLRCDGRHVDRDVRPYDAPLVFWGEWEPPSYVRRQWPINGALPRFLHEPVWEYPTDSEPQQNTDPWVFGDCFRYSNCRQLDRPALQTLSRGSVILFGSTLSGQFVLDTVFVVRDAQRFRTSQPPDTDDAFRVCTMQSLMTDSDCSGEAFVLYRGATYEAPVEGMYSFVPCRRADRADLRFARPPVSLPGYIDPSSWRGPSGTNKPRSITELRQLWEKVRQQVLVYCLLGVSFATPPLDDRT
jgi:hypothetical protein